MLIKHSFNGLTWYGFSLFDSHPRLRHGVFTRFGGVGGLGGEFSMSFGSPGPRENIQGNIRKAAAALGLPWPAFVLQNHGDRVAVIRPSDDYHPNIPEEAYKNYDALVAPEPGVNLLIKVADCQAIILHDPVTGGLGLVHSGWRGSVRNIIGATVRTMADLGVAPADLKAAISPSLGPCCAEFINYRQELPEEFQEFMVRNNYFDFWAISRRQLAEAGVKSENVEVAGVCTKCSPEFFSYRGGDQWGRFGVMAGVAAES